MGWTVGSTAAESSISGGALAPKPERRQARSDAPRTYVLMWIARPLKRLRDQPKTATPVLSRCTTPVRATAMTKPMPRAATPSQSPSLPRVGRSRADAA